MISESPNPKVLVFVYDTRIKKFLLLRTKGGDAENGLLKWYTVKGEVGIKDSFEKTVKEEVYEETGLIVKEVFDLKRECSYDLNKQTYEEKYFLVFVDDSENIKLDNVKVVDYMLLEIDEFVKSIVWNQDREDLKLMLEKGINKEITEYVPKKIHSFNFEED
jgi:8-oxo-dGTP pyrophosphatase MutT (NUDIX family)